MLMAASPATMVLPRQLIHQVTHPAKHMGAGALPVRSLTQPQPD